MTTDDPLPDSACRFSPTIAIQTVGCKLNQAESETLARRFIEAGFTLVSPHQEPDIFVLNSCTVTHIADRKCRQYLRAFHRRNPDSLVAVTGCYVDRDREGAAVEGVDILVRNVEKDQLVSILKERLSGRLAWVGRNGTQSLTGMSRTRSMVKIQEGCSHGCSYCIVPLVRGPEKSTPVGTVLSDVKKREREGYHEIVLTGTRIGEYGEGIGIEGLLERILEETDIARIRLSSLQPGEVSDALIDLWHREDRICRHLHMALQSGCDDTLRRMKRSYTINEYVSTVNRVSRAIPDIAVTTDIITGFPGETDNEFEESFRVCASISFANMHVFPYSVRTDTSAAKLTGSVPEKTKRARSHKMIELARRSACNFHSRFYGREMPVLWEEHLEGNIWAGYTSNYIKVYTSSHKHLSNCLTVARLKGEYQDQVWCDIHSMSEPSETVIKGV